MGQKTGLEKTMGKMFDGTPFAGGIHIAVPEDRSRMSVEERRELEDGARAGRGSDGGPSAAGPLQEQEAAGGVRGRGRPRKDAEEGSVAMNFRVAESFRQRLRMESARRGVSIQDLMIEAFELYFGKYGQ